MDEILAAAASGLRSRMEALDVLGNNLANAATNGYKLDREMYNLYFGNAMGGGTASPMPIIEGQWIDFSQGVLQVTDNPLDIALQGKGFLAVTNGDNTLYTRNGSLRLSEAGVLQTQEGYPVRSVGGGQIKAGHSGVIEISHDGTVRQAGQVLGRLEIVTFENSRGVTKHGKTYFRSSAPAVEARDVEVLQGKIEGSNVSTSEAATRIVNVMRQFEMLQKAVAVTADMNRRAVNDVAKTR